MLRFSLRRIATSLPTILIISIIIFGLIALSPGDPAVAAAGPEASREAVEAIRITMGLDQPVHVRYFNWLSSAVRGDLGESLLTRSSVTGNIVARLPVTISLTFSALVISLLISIPMGITAALKSGSWVDRAVISFTSAGIALPSFAAGLLLIWAFAIANPIFPATGYTPITESPTAWLQSMVLPGLALGLASAAELTRHLRASLRDVLQSDYIRTARSKGLGSRLVIGKHGLKHAAIPVITVLGLQLRFLLGGSIVVEQVFALQGIGTMAIGAVYTRDYPTIQGVVLFIGVVVVAVNLLVDLSYGYFNPRVRAA